MAKFVFEKIEDMDEAELDRIFEKSRTISHSTSELRNLMDTMKPGDWVRIYLDDEGENLSEDEVLKRMERLRGNISAYAAKKQWPFIPGGNRRAYQTAPEKDGDTGRIYLFFRRLEGKGEMTEDHRSING